MPFSVPIQRLRRPGSAPLLAVYLGGIALLVVGIAVVHLVLPSSSDDVAVQVILETWRDGFHRRAFLPPDTFVLKWPLYLALDGLVADPTTRLLAASLLFAVAGYTVFFVAMRGFLHRGGRSPVVLLPFAWAACLGFEFAAILRVPNGRNLEIGIAFLLLALGSVCLTRRGPAPAAGDLARAAVAVVLAGLFAYHDPYGLYVLGLPFAVLLVGRMALDGFDRRAAVVVGVVVGSLAAARAWAAIFAAASFVESPHAAPLRLATADQLGANVGVYLRSVLRIFNVDVLGRPVASLDAARFALTAGLLAVLLAYPLQLLRARDAASDVGRFAVSSVPYSASAIFLLSGSIVDVTHARYLVVVPFAMAITAGFVLEALPPRPRRAFAALIVAVLALNLASLLRFLPPPAASPNAWNHRVIAVVRDLGLKKGYTGYWFGHINTYLSGETVHFVPVLCVDGRLRPFEWFADDGAFARPAERSFFLYDESRPTIAGCRPEDIAEQVGQPSRIVAIEGSTRVAVYEDDIGVAIVGPQSGVSTASNAFDGS